MTIDEFAIQAKKAVDAFTADWKKNNKESPDIWPLDVEEGILWEGLWDFSDEEMYGDENR